jgi:hypothetical protein
MLGRGGRRGRIWLAWLVLGTGLYTEGVGPGDAGEVADGGQGIGSAGEVGGVENISSDAAISIPEYEFAAIVVKVSVTVFVDWYRGVVVRGR